MLFSLFLWNAWAWESEVTTLWPTIIEVINITQSVGGPELDSFSDAIANEAIRKWESYVTESDLPPERMNDAFFHYQNRLFDRNRKSLDPIDYSRESMYCFFFCALFLDVTWPGLQALPEYRRLRGYMEKFGLRYLHRLGFTSLTGLDLFSWGAVHSNSDSHGPHTHTGELVVGVYYAKVTGNSGRLRLFDPRGQVPPFGKIYDFNCQSGQMIFFPSWLQHAALPTKDDTNDHRVIFAFNIGLGGIGELRSLEWHLDPVSGYQNVVTEPITHDDCEEEFF